jgi:tRNA(Ile)-lysidine synthase
MLSRTLAVGPHGTPTGVGLKAARLAQTHRSSFPVQNRAVDTEALPLPPRPDAPILVGFSGGMDSTVLLHALAADPAVRARGLRAIHVDHALHVRSLEWSEHCIRECAALGVELAVARLRIVDDGCGPEAAARAARLAAFAQALQPGEWLALAHHRDDQAETVLLRLLRASGGGGLAAMRATRPFAEGTLWRPLLELPRARLHEYAQAHGLRWIEDPSNAQAVFDRNYLRLEVLPALERRWPQAAEGLARSAALLGEDAGLLAQETARRLALLQRLDPRWLDRAALGRESAPWRARLLRAWVDSLGLPPLPARILATIESDLLPARADAEACVEWSGAILRAWRDGLHCDVARAGLPEAWTCTWDGRGELALPTGDRLECLETTGGDPAPTLATIAPLRLSARVGGERLVLPGRTHSHAVKKLLHALEVPPWERARLPLVHAADGEVLAVGDVLVSARLAALGARFALVPVA